MTFDKSKVYTALDAEELEVGSVVILANYLESLKCQVEAKTWPSYVLRLDGIMGTSSTNRFRSGNQHYNLAYLVSKPSEAKPERKVIVAKRCSNCVHEHCSATKEPCVSCKPEDSKYEVKLCKPEDSKYEARLCETCEYLGYSDDSEPCSSCSDENGYPNWKPVKKWRPYKSSAEMIMDFIDRFKVNCPSYAEPLVWVKDKATDARHLVTSFVPDSDDNDSYVELFESTFNFDELFKYYTYLDGSPCGMEE